MNFVPSQAAIGSALNHVAGGRKILLAIANHAFTNPLIDENADRLRSLSLTVS
jgi:hypothetical protein